MKQKTAAQAFYTSLPVMAGVTMLTRFLPFMVFRDKVPSYVKYLGKVLPPAIIGMLLIAKAVNMKGCRTFS